MGSEHPTLLQYARFYNIAKDPEHYSPLNYIDDTCEPIPPIPPFEGLNAETPEERLKDVERRFCNEIMLGRIPIKAADKEFLGDCLKLDIKDKNLWRGILPEVQTSDLQPESHLPTMAEARDLPAPQFHPPYNRMLFSFPANPPMTPAHVASPSPSLPIGVQVPSGPDVPYVPGYVRGVFDQFNSDDTAPNTDIGEFAFFLNPTVQPQELNAAAHLAGDAMPLVGPSGEVLQLVSIESDPVPGVDDEESEDQSTSTSEVRVSLTAFDL